jgi:hypothetical protein
MRVTKVHLPLGEGTVGEPGTPSSPTRQLKGHSVLLPDEQRELLEALFACRVPYELWRSTSAHERQRTDDEVARACESAGEIRARLRCTTLDHTTRALSALLGSLRPRRDGQQQRYCRRHQRAARDC